ncbi:MAG: cache domain-containing protein, partial [Nocardioidaceae bacterium]
MRRAPFLALLVGVVLLSAGLLAMTGAIAQERQRDKTLQHDASQVASAFSSYFERARSLDLLLAQSPAFRPPPREDIDNAAANTALVYLERLYPGAISEACLIDEQGRELARVTEGVPAPVGDLSSAESENAFFVHTLALKPGEVYQAPPYVSSDTHEWVISNSTRIRQPNGRLLLVHFEVSLASFMHLVTPSSAGGHVAVVDRASGRTILEDGVDLPATAGNDFPLSPAAAALSAQVPESRLITVSGQRLAVGAVSRTPGNA